MDKVNRFLLLIIRFSLVVAIAFSAYDSRWVVLFVSFFTLILISIPRVFEDRYKIDLPPEFEILIVLFIYATLFLGEANGYYTKFWGWDLVLHAGSALALGFVGFTILYIMYKTYKIDGSYSTIAVFSFFFALGIGALWEIFEFWVDGTFGLNMQKSGLVDTMWDLIVDALGALIASISGYFYLKKGEAFIFTKIVKEFEEDNPHLFKRKRLRK